MKKHSYLIACGLLCCALAATPAKAYVTAEVTSNKISFNPIDGQIDVTINFSATTYDQLDATLTVNDQLYYAKPETYENYYLHNGIVETIILPGAQIGYYRKRDYFGIGFKRNGPAGKTYNNDVRISTANSANTTPKSIAFSSVKATF